MKKRIAIITDSTSDISQSVARQLGITIVPLAVNFGMEQFRDGIDITSEEFYPRLAASKTLPTTSQPSPADFKQLYEQALETHESVLSIHLSSGLSGTLEAANTARDMVDGKVEIFDSKSISLGIGALVAEAVELVGQGLPLEEVVAGLEAARSKTEVLFTLDTLEYLHKGGRIGKVQAVMGALLNIKPIVRVVDGIYVPAGKARRQEQALQELVRIFQSIAQDRPVKRMAVAHGAALEGAERLTALMEKTFGIKSALITQVGPVIGVHTGPGTIGACIQLA